MHFHLYNINPTANLNISTYILPIGISFCSQISKEIICNKISSPEPIGKLIVYFPKLHKVIKFL